MIIRTKNTNVWFTRTKTHF